MADSMNGPHLPYDVLTDVRFWMQIIRDSKRTIYTPPELAEATLERVCEMGLEEHFDVQASAACPKNRILIVDTQAIDAGIQEAFQHGGPINFGGCS